jgi:deoxycytidylate deaminase
VWATSSGSGADPTSLGSATFLITPPTNALLDRKICKVFFRSPQAPSNDSSNESLEAEAREMAIRGEFHRCNSSASPREAFSLAGRFEADVARVTSDIGSIENGEVHAVEDARSALKAMVRREPERHPLVIGLVAPIGADHDSVTRSLTESLRRYDYEVFAVHLSRLLDELDYAPWGTLPEKVSPDYYSARMDAGDRLRHDVEDGSALAALAVAKIKLDRVDQDAKANRAFVLRSLKHPAEVELLRHVYGDAFTLVAVASTASERRDSLEERLSLFENATTIADELILRDESENAKSLGQDVEDVYAMADVFVPCARGLDSTPHVDRYVDSLFGAPFLTPLAHEEGMRIAYDASLRSAAVGRQVGAALVPKIGTPAVMGTNEVPRPGGGQFWEGDEPDFRDFQTGHDPNPLYTRRVVQELLERLGQQGWLIEQLRGMSGGDLLLKAASTENGSSILKGARAASLIEFTRCLHAEQSAIIGAARAGVSTQDASLYTTTFPCHECAKMILGAGIIEVHYIEPYPKSMVARLYRDLIDTAPPVGAEAGLIGGKVPFKSFVGIAPRRYETAFTAGVRRQQDEVLVDFDRRVACPRTNGWSETAIELRESYVTSAIARVIEALAEAERKRAAQNLAPAQAKPAPRRKKAAAKKAAASQPTLDEVDSGETESSRSAG